MKTILHSIDTTGPGGAETVFMDLATRLPKVKYRPIVVIRGRGWLYEELSQRGVKPVCMDPKGSFNWRYLMGLAGLVRREGVDLIQSHLLGSNVYCSLAGLLTHTPVVATFHGAVDIKENERLKGFKFRSINMGARYIVAVSDSLRRDIVDRTPIKARKSLVIYNGIETANYQRPKSDTLRQQYSWSNDDIVIGSLGNIRPAKGYEILLRAAALLENSAHRFRFVVAGQGKTGLFDDLQRMRNELGLQNIVQFVGFVDDPADFLSNLDMYLLPSISEGFSIATIQAMAASLPAIVTRSGGPQEIITHGENGWMVNAGDPAAIAEAILTLAADPGLRDRLAENGRERVEKTFDMYAMLAAYEDIYERL